MGEKLRFDAAAMACQLAFTKPGAEEANRRFSEMMSVYRGFVGEFDDPFRKVFALVPHGLSNQSKPI